MINSGLYLLMIQANSFKCLVLGCALLSKTQRYFIQNIIKIEQQATD